MFEQGMQYRETTEFPEGASMEHVLQEEMMFRRHRRLREAEELTYEFTTDPALLHQYYVLRSILLYRAVGSEISTEADSYDERSHILVARKGNQVVGGVRLIIRDPRKGDKPLWLERGGFSLADQLPQLELDKTPYCDFSRLAILEEFQQTGASLRMYEELYKLSSSYGVKYHFATATAPALRIQKRMLQKMGHHIYILPQVSVPERDGDFGKMRLILMTPKTEKPVTPELLNTQEDDTKELA